MGRRTLPLRLLVLASRFRSRSGPPPLPRRGRAQARCLGRLMTAKIGPILAALGAEVLLQRWLGGSADLLVAVVCSVVALLGRGRIAAT